MRGFSAVKVMPKTVKIVWFLNRAGAEYIKISKTNNLNGYLISF